MSEITPSQTVGPFFAYGLTPHGSNQWKPNDAYDWKDTFGTNLITPDASGERIHLEGRVFDGDGVGISDAMIEIWQADAQGRYADPRDDRSLPNAAFKGFGRSATDKTGAYGFDTIKPGTVPGPNGKPQAPHILVAVFSRGMLRQVYTRLYFADDAAIADDPILALVPKERRATLIAKRSARNGAPVYTLDIHMQGEQETVFFDI
jgi:protocatechuate 3,4-dioxygenase, alpha subunit